MFLVDGTLQTRERFSAAAAAAPAEATGQGRRRAPHGLACESPAAAGAGPAGPPRRNGLPAPESGRRGGPPPAPAPEDQAA